MGNTQLEDVTSFRVAATTLRMDALIFILGIAANLYLVLEVRRLVRRAGRTRHATAFQRASGRPLRFQRTRHANAPVDVAFRRCEQP